MNTIELLAEFSKWAGEVARLEGELAAASAKLAANTTYAGQAEFIASLERSLANAKSSFTVAETAAQAAGIDTTALVTTNAANTAVATTEAASLTSKAIEIFNAMGRAAGLTGRVATVAGGAASAGIAIAITVILARLIGGFSADAPVEAGDRSVQEALQQELEQSLERPADATAAAEAAGPVDTSGEWKLTWNWSVTTVNFVGTLSGGPSNWSFDGALESGGNAIWRPPVGAGQATCTLAGEPGASGASARMDCTATFTDAPASWTGQADGTLQTISHDSKTRLEYRGRGSGTATAEGQPASAPATIDHLDLQVHVPTS